MNKIELEIQNGYNPLSWNAFKESKIHKISCKIKSDTTEIRSRVFIDTKPGLSVRGQIVTNSEWGKQNNNCKFVISNLIDWLQEHNNCMFNHSEQ